MLFMTSLHLHSNTLWTTKSKYITAVLLVTKMERKKKLDNCENAQMFSLRQYWPTRSIVWYLSPHTPTTLECPLWWTCVSTQDFLNSYTFFSFWFIWWTGSRKLVIDMMPSLPCLTKTWSNHVHGQAGCSLGFFLWSGQLRIDFNKIQCWQQPWKKGWPWNLRKFPSCYFRWGSSHLDRISQG